MKIVVRSEDPGFICLKSCNAEVNWVQVHTAAEMFTETGAAAYFDLGEKSSIPSEWPYDKPLFINSVVEPLGIHCNRFVRMNAWEGFLQNASWELAGKIDEQVNAIAALLHKSIIETADVPGFISARVISMIINEAYFAKEENVSTEDEIDTAMKLGTNYPYGPFEWSRKIGPRNIFSLLSKLSATDKRYAPAASLAAMVKTI